MIGQLYDTHQRSWSTCRLIWTARSVEMDDQDDLSSPIKETLLLSWLFSCFQDWNQIGTFQPSSLPVFPSRFLTFKLISLLDQHRKSNSDHFCVKVSFLHLLVYSSFSPSTSSLKLGFLKNYQNQGIQCFRSSF